MLWVVDVILIVIVQYFNPLLHFRCRDIVDTKSWPLQPSVSVLTRLEYTRTRLLSFQIVGCFPDTPTVHGFHIIVEDTSEQTTPQSTIQKTPHPPDGLHRAAEFLGDLQVPDKARMEVVYPTMHPDRPLLDMLTYPPVQLSNVLDLQLDVFFDHDIHRRFLFIGETELLDAIDERREPTRDGVIGILGVLVMNVVKLLLVDEVVQGVAQRVMALELVFVRRATRCFQR
jgi:hypothetical protein